MKLKSFLVSGLVTFALAGCGGAGPQEVKKVSSEDIAGTEDSSKTSTSNNKVVGTPNYQAILDEYTKKLQEATPKLVNEYRNEAANNQNGIQGLTEISTNKLSKLGEISTEGISQMTEIHLSSDSGSSDEYEEWTKKLYDVYDIEAKKISDISLNEGQ